MSAADLTPKQASMLRYIQGHVMAQNCPPTIREIADALGISSTNGVRAHLTALVRKGWITIIPRLARGIRLTTTGIAEYNI